MVAGEEDTKMQQDKGHKVTPCNYWNTIKSLLKCHNSLGVYILSMQVSERKINDAIGVTGEYTPEENGDQTKEVLSASNQIRAERDKGDGLYSSQKRNENAFQGV